MKLEQSFTVAAPVDTVFAALTDVLRVAPCLPGANITEDAGDGTYKGEFKVKIGPTTATYVGALKILERDDAAHAVTMDAKGTDKRGNGGTTATIVSRVTADGDETRVDVDTDFSITGKLARFGRGGMIQDVSNRLLREFAANLQEDLAGGAPEAPSASGAQPEAPSAPAAEAPSAPAAEAPSAPAAEAASASLGAAGAAAPPESSARRAEVPPRQTAPPRANSEPLDGGGLVLDVVRDRLRAVLPGVLTGFVLGLLAARRWEIRRR